MLSVHGSMALNDIKYILSITNLLGNVLALAFRKRAHELLADSSVNTVV